MPRYGQKGGDSPNTGKTSTTYRAMAPDGTVLKKRTFHTSEPTALMSIYFHGDRWYVSGVYPVHAVPDWFYEPHRTPPITCERI